ncbi:unnamed protein product, partial [Brassica oleracea var. botrytis]
PEFARVASDGVVSWSSKRVKLLNFLNSGVPLKCVAHHGGTDSITRQVRRKTHQARSLNKSA